MEVKTVDDYWVQGILGKGKYSMVFLAEKNGN